MLSEEKIRELRDKVIEEVKRPVCSCGCEDDRHDYYQAQLRAYCLVLEEPYPHIDVVRKGK